MLIVGNVIFSIIILFAILDIAFENKDLRSICENDKKAKERYGEQITDKLKRRLADLRAVADVRELVAGNPSEIGENKFKLDLGDQYHLIFVSNHIRVPILNEDKIDWTKVKRIKILSIEKKHDY